MVDKVSMENYTDDNQFQAKNATSGLKNLRELRRTAQEELSSAFSMAFYALWDAGECPVEGVTKEEYQLVLEEQANRAERLWGFTNPASRS